MTRSKKFSALVATLVVGFLSIYAVTGSFLTSNHTTSQQTFTLKLQSGAQTVVTVDPGQSLPNSVGDGDKVVGVWLYGAYDPAGSNAIIPAPNGGTVTIMWLMSGSTPVGFTSEPDLGTLS